MTQEQIDNVTILSYLKISMETQAKILSKIENKSYDDALNYLNKNSLTAQKLMFEVLRDVKYKDNPKEQAEINTYVSNLDNQLSKL